MREQYAAEQNITIGSDGCFTEIDLRMYVSFTADVSESAETIKVGRISFYRCTNGYREHQPTEMVDWIVNRYLSSDDFKDWLQSVAVKIEERAKADAKLAEALS